MSGSNTHRTMTRQLPPRRCRISEFFTPGAPAPGALVTADPDQKRGGAMAERLVREQTRVRPL